MLHRRPVVAELLRDRTPDLLVVTGLGSPTWDVAATDQADENFHFNGAMGQAAPFALGLAIAQPCKRVLLITGDGELLMGLGTLATAANRAPANLAIAVLNNAAYAETGNQPTATAGPTRLHEIALACGFATSEVIDSPTQYERLRALALNSHGPIFVDIRIHIESVSMKFPPSFDGVTAMNRFRAAVLADEAGAADP